MIGKYRKQLIIASISYVGFTIFGHVSVWTSPVVEELLRNPYLLGAPVTTAQISWLASNTFLGAIITALPLGYITNRIGRRRTLMIGAIICPLSYICLAHIKNINVLIFCRLCLGLVLATILVVNLVYLGEIASTEIRGMILGTTGFFISFGMLLCFSIGPYVSYEVLNYTGVAISLVYLLGMFYIPESPVFLLRKGRDAEAIAVLLDLNRKEDVEKLSDVKLEIEASAQNVKWTKLFTVKCNRKAILICCVLYILQEFSGIAPLLVYSTTIFKISGSSIPAHIATIIIGVVQLLSGLITSVFIERYGRRFLLLLSTTLACLSLAVLSVYLNLDAYGNPVAQNMKWLPLPMAIIYFVAYGFGLGIIPATLVGEMFELNLRSAGTSVVLFVNFSTGFATTYAFGFLITGVGIHVAFVLFSAVCALAFFFTLFFVPETKGKSLLEVQKMLS